MFVYQERPFHDVLAFCKQNSAISTLFEYWTPYCENSSVRTVQKHPPENVLSTTISVIAFLYLQHLPFKYSNDQAA